MAKIEGNDPAAKVLHIKAASGQTEDILDVQDYAGNSYLRVQSDGTTTISGLGDMNGPASSTDNAVVRFDGTGGKTAQNSAVTIADTTGAIAINAHQALTDPTASPSGKFLKDDGTWDTPSGGSGDVVGPSGATDNAIARYDTTTGKLLQNSPSTIDDNGSMNIPTGQSYKINGTALAYGDVGAASSAHDHDSTYAPLAKGVTNGDSHDHSGGDGAQIAYASLSGTPTLGTAAAADLGTGADDAAYGNHNHSGVYAESSHAHGNITSVGAIGSTSGLPIITTTSGALTAGAFGTDAGQFCQGNDSRLSDARTPTAHDLTSAYHTDSGLTSGHFLKATGTTTFAWAAHGLTYSDVGASASDHNHTGVYAPDAEGVTNGDSHDHSGGDGAQISHTTLSNIGTNSHATIDSHLSSTSNPHGVTATQVSLGNVTNNAQVKKIASSTDNAVLRWDGTTGDLPQDSLVTIADSTGAISINGHQAITDPTASPSGKFLKDDGTWSSPSGSGDVVGPSSATDNALSRFDTTTGKLIQNSVITVADSTGALSINAHQALTDPGASPSGLYLKDDGTWSAPSGSGDVVGPASSTDNQIARFHETTGKVIQVALPTIDDNGSINIPSGQSYKVNGSALTYTDVGAAASSHAHGNITNAGAIGSTADLPIKTTTSGVLTTGAFGTGAGEFCQGNDSRLSDTREPTAHDLTSAYHTDSGLTTGHFLKATGTTTFAFAAHGLTYSDVGAASSSHDHDSTYAPIAKGVTNGDSHDHSGGDGAQIDHTTLSNIGTNSHSTIDSHIANTSNPHSVDASDVGLGNVTNNAQVKKIGSSTDTAVLRWNGTSGDTPDDSLVTIADTTGAISIGSHQAITDPTASPTGKFLRDDGTWQTPSGSGDVTGPGSSTDNAVPRFDGTGGKTIQDSLVTVADTTGAININGHQAITDPTASPTGKYLKDNGTWDSPSGSGDVTGPASSTDNAIARFDGTGGKTLQNTSTATIDDSGNLTCTKVVTGANGLDVNSKFTITYNATDNCLDFTYTGA